MHRKWCALYELKLVHTALIKTIEDFKMKKLLTITLVSLLASFTYMAYAGGDKVRSELKRGNTPKKITGFTRRKG